MKIAVSACLLGENCKYNGGNNYSAKVADFTRGHEVVPICPEVYGGLPTPREPSEIVDVADLFCKSPFLFMTFLTVCFWQKIAGSFSFLICYPAIGNNIKMSELFSDYFRILNI